MQGRVLSPKAPTVTRSDGRFGGDGGHTSFLPVLDFVSATLPRPMRGNFELVFYLQCLTEAMDTMPLFE
jgi:hypothetical protein